MSQYIFVMNFDGMYELCCVLTDSSGDVGAEHWGCDNHWPTYDFFSPAMVTKMKHLVFSLCIMQHIL
jgi:hypothetical protein